MKRILAQCLLLSLIHTGILAQAGEPDTDFGVNGIAFTNVSQESFFYTTALQPDGKILAAGEIYINDYPFRIKSLLTRFNADGSIDSSFGKNGIVTLEINKRYTGFYSLAVQNDGYIIAAGYTGNHRYDDSPYVYSKILVARYKPNGRKDASFGDNGIALITMQHYDLTTNALSLQADGKIVLCGSLRSYGLSNSTYALVAARLLSNGQPDSSFNNKGLKIISNGYFSKAASLALTDNNQLIICGLTLPEQNSNAQYLLVQLQPDGSLDPAFGKKGKTVTELAEHFPFRVQAMARQQNGKIIVAGGSYNNLSYDDFTLIQFNANGTIDSAFGINGLCYTDFGYEDVANALTLQADGKIIAAGISENPITSNVAKIVLARYKTNGSIDKSFGNKGKVITQFPDDPYAAANAVALQSDGKIIAVGYAGKPYGFKNKAVVTRYLNDPGTVMPSIKRIPANQFQVFPNPADNLIHIQGLDATSPAYLQIKNSTGVLFKRLTVTSSQFTWNIADLPFGIYYVTIRQNEQEATIQILKK